MSGKTIVIQPRTTQTALPKRLLVFVVSVLAVSVAIVFGSMASNESAAVAEGVDRRVDYAFRHPGETFLVPASQLEQMPDYLTRYLTRHAPVSDPAELHRSPDYGIRHMADWRALEFVTSMDQALPHREVGGGRPWISSVEWGRADKLFPTHRAGAGWFDWSPDTRSRSPLGHSLQPPSDDLTTLGAGILRQLDRHTDLELKTGEVC